MLVRIDDSESQLNKRQFASLANTATNAYFAIFLRRIIKHTINHCERSHIMIDTLSKKSIIKKLCSVGTIAVRCLSEFTYLGNQKDCVSLQIQYKNNMSDKKIILLAFGVTFVAIITYVICFWGTGVSKNTTDWGAFGNYAAICVSTLSIALIYVTYREQRNANEITRTEQHIATMNNTLIDLIRKRQSKLETYYSKFCEHFKVSFVDLTDCEYDGIVKVCTYYYSSTMIDDDSANLNYLFQYVKLCIDYVIHNKVLSKGDKQLRMTELSCIIPESIRVLFFCWLIPNNPKVLKEYHELGLFILDDTGSDLIKNVIAFVCTQKCPPKKQMKMVDLYGIILDDHPDEQFFDTYFRLNGKEQET